MSGLFRSAPAILAAAMTLCGSSLAAQRFYDDDDVAGAETCRSIWRDFGRTMSGRPSAVFCEIREIGTAPRSSLIDVDGGVRNGVRITGAARSDTRVRLVIQAQGDNVEDARGLARQVSLDIASPPLRARIPDIDDDRRRGRRFVAATIVIDAPVESNITARVEHAPMDIENVRGRIDVSAEHGPLHLREVGGDVRARVAHGPLTVDLTGKQWTGTGLDAEAAHGPLTLRLPRDYGAELEIGAEHGPIDSDFPLTLTRFDRSRIQTKLGAGGPQIRAIARHGPMSLRIQR
jgi:hypothetical protein